MHTLRLFILGCFLLSVTIAYYGFLSPSSNTITIHDSSTAVVNKSKPTLLDTLTYPQALVETQQTNKLVQHVDVPQAVIATWYKQQLTNKHFHVTVYNDSDVSEQQNYAVAAENNHTSLAIIIRKKAIHELTDIIVTKNP